MSNVMNIPQTFASLDSRVTADSTYIRVNSKSASTNNAFANGPHHFEIPSLGPDKYWIPSKSYISMRVSLKDGNGTELKGQEIALSQNCCGNLFSNASFHIHNTTITSVHSQHAEIDALTQRLNKSESWFKSQGKDIGQWGTYAERKALTDTSAPVEREYTNPRPFTSFNYAAGRQIKWTAGVAELDAANLPAGQPKPAFLSVGDLIFKQNSVTGRVTNGPYIVIDTTSQPGQFTIGTYRGNTLTDMNFENLVAGDERWMFQQQKPRPSTEGKSRVELLWKPSCPIFSVSHGIPSLGDLYLSLTPHTNYLQRAVETRGVTSLPQGDYTFTVEEFYLNCLMVKSVPFSSPQYALDMSYPTAHVTSVSNAGQNTENLIVDPGTDALIVMFTDARANNDTRMSNAAFKSYKANLTDGKELKDESVKLQRLQVVYGGRQYPDLVEELTEQDANWIVSQWYKGVVWGGKSDMEAAHESIDEWNERGRYYLVRTDKVAQNNSTRVTIHTQFLDALNTDKENMQMVVVALRRRMAAVLLDAASGRIKQVEVTG